MFETYTFASFDDYTKAMIFPFEDLPQFSRVIDYCIYTETDKVDQSGVKEFKEMYDGTKYVDHNGNDYFNKFTRNFSATNGLNIISRLGRSECI